MVPPQPLTPSAAYGLPLEKKILWAPLNIRTVDRPRLCKAPEKSSPSLGGSWSHQTHGSMAHRVYIANGTSTVLARNVWLILVRGGQCPLPPEAKKVLKI